MALYLGSEKVSLNSVIYHLNSCAASTMFYSEKQEVIIRAKGIGDVSISCDGDEIKTETLAENAYSEIKFLHNAVAKRTYKILNIKNITELDLSNNDITDIIFNESNNIKKLVLNNNKLDKLDCSHFDDIQFLHMFENPMCKYASSMLSCIESLPNRSSTAMGSIIFYPWYGLETLIEEHEGNYYKYPYLPDDVGNINHSSNPNRAHVYTNGAYEFQAKKLYGVVVDNSIKYYTRSEDNTYLEEHADLNRYTAIRKELEFTSIPKNWAFGSAILYDEEDSKRCFWDFIQNNVADVWETTEKGFGHKIGWFDEVHGTMPDVYDMNIGSLLAYDGTALSIVDNIADSCHSNGTLSIMLGRGGISRFGYCPNAVAYLTDLYKSGNTGFDNGWFTTGVKRISEKVDSIGFDIMPTRNYKDELCAIKFRNLIGTVGRDKFVCVANGNDGDGLDWSTDQETFDAAFSNYSDIEPETFNTLINADNKENWKQLKFEDWFDTQIDTTTLNLNLSPGLYFIEYTDPDPDSSSDIYSLSNNLSSELYFTHIDSNGNSRTLNRITRSVKNAKDKRVQDAYISVLDLGYSYHLIANQECLQDICNRKDNSALKIYQITDLEGNSLPAEVQTSTIYMSSISPFYTSSGYSCSMAAVTSLKYTRNDSFTQFGEQMIISKNRSGLTCAQGTSYAIPAGHSMLVLMCNLYKKYLATHNLSDSTGTGKDSNFMNHVRTKWTKILENLMDTVGYGIPQFLCEPKEFELLKKPLTIYQPVDTLVQYSPFKLLTEVTGNCKKTYTLGQNASSEALDDFDSISLDDFIRLRDNTLYPLKVGNKTLRLYSNSSLKNPTNHLRNYFYKDIPLTFEANELSYMLINNSINEDAYTNAATDTFTIQCKVNLNALSTTRKDGDTIISKSIADLLDTSTSTAYESTYWWYNKPKSDGTPYARVRLLKVKAKPIADTSATPYPDEQCLQLAFLSKNVDKYGTSDFRPGWAYPNAADAYFAVGDPIKYTGQFGGGGLFKVAYTDTYSIITLTFSPEKIEIFYNGTCVTSMKQDAEAAISLSDITTGSPYVETTIAYDRILSDKEIAENSIALALGAI